MRYKSKKGICPEFCEIRGVYIIEHGEWSDWELFYKGYTAWYGDVMDYIDEEYTEEYGERPGLVKIHFYCKYHPQLVKDTIVKLWKQSRK